jgi:hypothetical protein
MALRSRAAAACIPCKMSKMKCGDARPCARCQKRAASCVDLKLDIGGKQSGNDVNRSGLVHSTLLPVPPDNGSNSDKCISLDKAVSSWIPDVTTDVHKKGAGNNPFPETSSGSAVSFLPASAQINTSFLQQGMALMKPQSLHGGTSYSDGMDAWANVPLMRCTVWPQQDISTHNTLQSTSDSRKERFSVSSDAGVERTRLAAANVLQGAAGENELRPTGLGVGGGGGPRAGGPVPGGLAALGRGGGD